MKIRLFDPAGIKPEDYKHRYPEIERADEFSLMSGKAIIFIWWYANPTSDLVISVVDDYERVELALQKSGYTPNKSEKERILKLQFDTDLSAAIKKMSSFDVGARFKSYTIVRKIFQHYQYIIEQGPDQFKETVGSGDNKVDVVDYKRYVDTSAKIADTIPSLLTKLEEGFGIVDAGGNEVEEETDGGDTLRDYHIKKTDENN